MRVYFDLFQWMEDTGSSKTQALNTACGYLENPWKQERGRMVREWNPSFSGERTHIGEYISENPEAPLDMIPLDVEEE